MMQGTLDKCMCGGALIRVHDPVIGGRWVVCLGCGGQLTRSGKYIPPASGGGQPAVATFHVGRNRALQVTTHVSQEIYSNLLRLGRYPDEEDGMLGGPPPFVLPPLAPRIAVVPVDRAEIIWRPSVPDHSVKIVFASEAKMIAQATTIGGAILALIRELRAAGHALPELSGEATGNVTETP